METKPESKKKNNILLNFVLYSFYVAVAFAFLWYFIGGGQVMKGLLWTILILGVFAGITIGFHSRGLKDRQNSKRRIRHIIAVIMALVFVFSLIVKVWNPIITDFSSNISCTKDTHYGSRDYIVVPSCAVRSLSNTLIVASWYGYLVAATSIFAMNRSRNIQNKLIIPAIVLLSYGFISGLITDGVRISSGFDKLPYAMEKVNNTQDIAYFAVFVIFVISFILYTNDNKKIKATKKSINSNDDMIMLDTDLEAQNKEEVKIEEPLQEESEEITEDLEELEEEITEEKSEN